MIKKQITHRLLFIFRSEFRLRVNKMFCFACRFLFLHCSYAIQNHCITLQTLIMPTYLCDFIVCQIVTLKNLRFSNERIADQIGFHIRFSARSSYQPCFLKMKILTPEKAPKGLRSSQCEKKDELWDSSKTARAEHQRNYRLISIVSQPQGQILLLLFVDYS